jgi:hypothetical protein
MMNWASSLSGKARNEYRILKERLLKGDYMKIEEMGG